MKTKKKASTKRTDRTTSKPHKAASSDINDQPKVQKPAKTELTEFEARFCEEYVVDLNATQAYLRARTDKEIKPSTASVEGSKLLAKPNIQAKVRDLSSARSQRTKITAETVLEGLNNMASVDITKFYDGAGGILLPHKWPPGYGQLVSSITHNDFGGIKSIKVWEKGKAYELLGKHLKLFVDRVEHSGQVGLVELLALAKKKEQDG